MAQVLEIHLNGRQGTRTSAAMGLSCFSLNILAPALEGLTPCKMKQKLPWIILLKKLSHQQFHVCDVTSHLQNTIILLCFRKIKWIHIFRTHMLLANNTCKNMNKKVHINWKKGLLYSNTKLRINSPATMYHLVHTKINLSQKTWKHCNKILIA